MVTRITLAIFFAASAVLAQQQPPQYGEKVDVNLVLLDAVVTDARGNQILGLDKNDFVIKENGVPQAIDSVDYFTNRRLLNSPESKAAFKVERVHEQRYFIFFFDKPADTGMFFNRLALARSAVKEFIRKEMKPSDVAAVVAHDVRLKVYSDFTSNREQLERAVDETALFGRGITISDTVPDAPSILRGSASTLIDSTGTVYEALELLGERVRGIRARKEIVLFSLGIHEPGEEIRGGMIVTTSRYYEPMVRALNRSDVAVYPVSLLEDPNQPPYVHQALERIASDTNGQYFRFNTSFSPALRQVDKLSTGYYLIGYYTKPKNGAGYQKVNVAVKNPEFRVRARQGYSYGD
ncbi:MAG TPA: VWA domain-containing protein [Thermoanaerobaculia bacterium]|nr:VWA domain-containing protein [Thermoanaerobaculia bacterium]